MKHNNPMENSSLLAKDEAQIPSESALPKAQTMTLRQEIDQWYYHDHEYLDEIEFGEIIRELE